MKKAIVALARRLAVILHRIRVDGIEFRWIQLRQFRDNNLRSLESGPFELGHLRMGFFD
jgi:hypothetical protein